MMVISLRESAAATTTGGGTKAAVSLSHSFSFPPEIYASDLTLPASASASSCSGRNRKHEEKKKEISDTEF